MVEILRCQGAHGSSIFYVSHLVEAIFEPEDEGHGAMPMDTATDQASLLRDTDRNQPNTIQGSFDIYPL